MQNQPKRKVKAVPDTIDILVGGKVQAYRKALGISQEKLAEALGVTFQQVRKYEKGINRISAGRLYKISNFLQIDISYFFHLDNAAENKNSQAPKLSSDDLELLALFSNIQNTKFKKSLLEFIKTTLKEKSTE